MAQRYHYYGMAGVNGYAVYEQYDLVLENRSKLKEVNTAGFYRFHEAKAWAEQRFLSLQAKYHADSCQIPVIKETNKLYYREIREEDTRDYIVL